MKASSLKSALRRHVPASHWEFLSWYRDVRGFGPAVMAYLRLLYRSGDTALLPNPRSAIPVLVRAGTTDQNVYKSVFLDEEFNIKAGDPQFIVDVGAHIGLSSVYFATKWPAARIVALEPERGNYELLRKNVSRYPQIEPVQAAVCRNTSRVIVTNPEAASWSFRVEEGSGSGSVPCYRVRDVMTRHGFPRIDVLKMDIEGGEMHVLADGPDWLPSIGTLIIELHDRLVPGCSAALERALIGLEYSQYRTGEKVVITDIGPRTP